MDRDPLISTFFNLSIQAVQANIILGEKAGEKYDMAELQKIVTSIVITKDRHGALEVSSPPIEPPDGYQGGPPTTGSYSPSWAQFDPNVGQIPCPEEWDGSELCMAPKWKGKAWSTLPDSSVEAYTNKNDDTKYHNKARWETERRTALTYTGGADNGGNDDDDLPF